MPNRQTIWLSSSMTFTWTNSNFTYLIYQNFYKISINYVIWVIVQVVIICIFLLGLIHMSNNEWTGNNARISPKSVVKDVKKRKVKTNIIIWWHAWLHAGTQLEQVSYFTIWCKGQLRGVRCSITIIIFKKNWALGAHALLHHHMSYMWAWPCSFTKPSSPYKYTHWFELQLHLCFFSCILAIVIIYLKSASTSLLFLISSPGIKLLIKSSRRWLFWGETVDTQRLTRRILKRWVVGGRSFWSTKCSYKLIPEESHRLFGSDYASSRSR